MRAQKIKLIAGIIVAMLGLVSLPLFGQGGTETSTGVARVGLIRGDVSMERGDANEWVGVTVNTPLVPGDAIATGAGARAEVQLNYSNVLRLDQNTAVKIADLNDSRIQLQVARGLADLAVFKENQANSEVDTPNVAVSPLQPGTYRIEVDSGSMTLVTVRDGQAQVSTPQGSTNINAGQQITVEGEQNPQYKIVDAAPLDNWDYWNRERNGVIESASNYSHVNQYYTGAQDLNSYGRWTYVPGYDWCWTPYANAGWVPYSYGRWVWEPFYGWTWVSYDPWGWAPYHYGRWFFYGSSWFWWPGAVTPYYRPLWAPAYVSFFGFGYGRYHYSFGYGYGFRSIGWCPLGPHDEFHRWWGHGRDHSFNVVNINNYYGRGGGRGGHGYGGSNMAEVGNNFHVRRAIVTMSADRFGREAVPRNHQIVTATMLHDAKVVHGTLPVVPTRESLRVTNRNVAVPAVARGRASNTRFFTRRAVALPASEHSFNNQAASIRHMVENRNVQAPGVNRPGASPAANRGFQMSRPTGQQNAQNAGRQSPAPIVRENVQPGQRPGNGAQRNVEANRSGFRNFGTGAPAIQGRGSQERPNSAPVVRENPQPSQNVNPGGRNIEANRPGFRNFGTGAPAEAQARGNAGRVNSAPAFRESPQPSQNVSPGGRNVEANRPGFRNFGTEAPAIQGRGSPNSAPVVRENPQPQQNTGTRSVQTRSNFRNFSGNAPGAERQVPNNNSQRFYQGGNSAPRSQPNNNGFRQFTPQPAPQPAPRNEGRFNNPVAQPRSYNNGGAGWNRFPPQREAPAQRGGGGYYNRGAQPQGYSQPRVERQPNFGNSGNYSRPPLQLNKPIVSEPRYSGNSRPSYGGGSQPRSAPSYHGNSGGGSRGSYSAPSHSSGRSGGGGGGHRR